MLTFTNFEAFKGPHYGIKMLNTAEKTKTLRDILNFQSHIPLQPFFYITRESWEKLSAGVGIDLNTQKLEVYGFTFCFAITDNDFIPNLKYANLYANLLDKLAYFRVRTILVKKKETIKSGEKTNVYVETDNIAFVDVSIAMNNYFNATREDCLVIVNRNTQQRIVDGVDRGVQAKNKTSYSSPLPESLKVNPSKENPSGMIFKNDGGIFSKERIWDQLLVKEYCHSAGTLVSLAIGNVPNFDKKRPGFSQRLYFNFKINGQGNTSIDCPFPPVCGSVSS